MREMRKAAISIVIVLDEYGSTVGLITLEDMLEGDCPEISGRVRWRRGKVHTAHRPAGIHGRRFGQT